MKKTIIVILLGILFSGIAKADLTQFGFTNDYLTAVSSTDGLGNFTYSFTQGTNSLPYEFYTQDIVLQMDSSVISDITSPSGWSAQLNEGVVNFSWTNTSPIDALSEVPIVFEIQTSFSESTLNPEGIATFSSPVGYTKFDYIQPIPEPSTISFLAISSFGIYLFRKRIRR